MRDKEPIYDPHCTHPRGLVREDGEDCGIPDHVAAVCPDCKRGIIIKA